MNLEEFIQKIEEKGIEIKVDHYVDIYGDCLNFYYEGKYLTNEFVSGVYDNERAYKSVIKKYTEEKESKECQALIRTQGLSKALEKYGDKLVYHYDLLGVLSDFKENKKSFSCVDTDGVTRRYLKKDKIKELELSCFRVWAD